MKAAVFVDRDGTMIEERGYLDSLDAMQLFPWTAAAVRDLRSAGYPVIVITNQAGVARGYFDEAFVRTAHAHLDRLLAAEGAAVDGYYYCPHHPEGRVESYRITCGCRKPATGMLDAAARDHGIDLSRSFMIGVKWLDVALAQNAGASGILVRTGYGTGVESAPSDEVRPAAIVDTLGEAANWILGREARS
jgi:D-glycero-D-manno-heptose 1,7-bisphosphate phosphatase